MSDRDSYRHRPSIYSKINDSAADCRIPSLVFLSIPRDKQLVPMKTKPHQTLAITLASVCLTSVTANALPDGWEINIFAKPPQAEYPTAIAAAANGDIFISSDPNGSLGHIEGLGKVVRAKDTSGDGVADDFLDYIPHVSSPRGGHMVGDTFYLIHPPYLSAWRDTTGDGVADEQKVLVKGFGWGIEHPRGADHTTNAVRMGIDGWLYVAVGDFGMPDAVGSDGTRLTLNGGGIVRVRPDGSEMEPFAIMTRNNYDIAISPTLDIFTRDNTNDGKGWNTRFLHFVPGGNYGYPRLYQNFSDEIVTPLADYGGGSGTGALYLNEPGFPEGYGDTVFTTDWTTGMIHRHPLKPMEATFIADQETFHPLVRAVDIDVDGSSVLYLADWRNGAFKYTPDKKVGMIHRVTPPNWQKREFPDLGKTDDATLVKHIAADSAVMRLEAQQEILKRGDSTTFAAGLLAIANDKSAHLYGRVSAIFTLKQLQGSASNTTLARLAADGDIREFALRALADRKPQSEGADPELFLKFINDPNPRVRLHAIHGLGRLQANQAAPAIIASFSNANLHPGELGAPERRFVPHVAIKTLVSLNAVEASLDASEDPTTRPIALRVLQEIHSPEAVDGLIRIVKNTTNHELRDGALGALARLYFTEGPWDLKEFWGTRPDDRGPYFRPAEWEATARIRQTIEDSFTEIDVATRDEFISLLALNRIPVSELKFDGLDPLVLALSVKNPDQSILALLGDAAITQDRTWDERVSAYLAISRAGPRDSLPHRVKILASWLSGENPEAAKHISDFVNETERGQQIGLLDNIAQKGTDAESRIAWKAMLTVRGSPLANNDSKKNVQKVLERNPLEIGFFKAIADLKTADLADNIELGIRSDNEKTIAAAMAAKEASSQQPGAGKKIGELPQEQAHRLAMEGKGDIKNGERLYISQGCIACHAVDPQAAQKGPYLGSAGAKFSRDYLIESILKPEAVVAQGFQSIIFTMNDGRQFMGFVTNEEDGQIELRDIAGQITQLDRAEVKEQTQLPQSMMPAGLGDSLTLQEFTDLIDYLVSLRAVGG